MKSFRTLLTICLLATAATMFAQTDTSLLLKSHIPFAFTVANRTIPAGNYLIYATSPDRPILISSVDGKYNVFVNTVDNQSNAASSKSSLMFQRYGSEYFLTEVWVANQQIVRAPLLSKRQVQLARSGAPADKTAIAGLTGR